MTVSAYRLSLSISTPKVVTEGETFDIIYNMKNIGNTVFPGGRIVVELSWSSLNEKVYQTINIDKPLPLNGETGPIRNSQAPLTPGYTWFYVADAIASGGGALEVFKNGGTQLWPHRQITLGKSVVQFRQPLYAVRARTHDEISQWRALWVAAGSLALLVLFQIINWLIQYYPKT
jgi:hypothetical protein